MYVRSSRNSFSCNSFARFYSIAPSLPSPATGEGTFGQSSSLTAHPQNVYTIFVNTLLSVSSPSFTLL